MTEQQVQPAPTGPVAEPVDNSRMWLLVAAPLLIFAIDAAFLYTGHSDSSTVSIGVALAVTIALASWDAHYLKSAGDPVVGMSSAWFVPGYLFQRSKVLRQSQAPLVVWIAALVVSITAGVVLDSRFATLDMTRVRTGIQQWVAQQGGGSASVTCPAGSVYAVHDTFVCDVSEGSTSAHVLVRVENSRGYVTWQIGG